MAEGSQLRPATLSCLAVRFRRGSGGAARHRAATVADWQPGSPRWHAAALLGYTLACAAWGWYAGRDLNWDQLNHHFYVAYNLLGDRLEHDFLAAGGQSYFNALGYLPFYGLVSLGIGSGPITAILGACHSINLWLLHAIGWTIFRSSPMRAALAVGGAVLGGLTPIFLYEVGSSYNEPFASAAQLASLLAVLRLLAGENRPPVRWLAFGAVMSGVSVGLKLTGALFAVLTCLMLAAAARRHMREPLALLVTGAGAVAGFVCTHGYWSWRLWQVHRNPVFPLFNDRFGSPDFSRSPLEHLRFVPDGWIAALRRPFDMAWPTPWVYAEMIVPDVRPMLLLLAMVALLLTSYRKSSMASDPSRARAWRYLGVYLVLGWIGWLAVSGNGRYAMGLLMLTGVALTGCLGRLFVAPARVVRAWLVVSATQVVLFLAPGDYRMTPAPHANAWFDVDPPATYRERPHAFVLTSAQSHAFVAPFLHRGSRFVTVGGSMPVSASGPGGNRALAIIGSAPDLATLVTVQRVDRHGLPTLTNLDEPRAVLSRFGLGIDSSGCRALARVSALAAGVVPDPGVETFGDQSLVGAELLVCRVVTGVPVSGVAPEIEAAFDRIERQCPRLFAPAGAAIETATDAAGRRGWWREYPNTDTRLAFARDIFTVTRLRDPEPLRIGSVGGGIDRPGVACVDGRRLTRPGEDR